MVNLCRDSEKERVWRGRLRRYAASNVTVRKFCEREGVRESSFFAWRRTIAKRDGVSNVQPNVDLGRRTPAFVPMVLTDDQSRDSSIEILLASGFVVKLPTSTSADRLADVVFALQSRGSQ